MTAYYYEKKFYNGILLTSDDRWIDFTTTIEDIDICRENIQKIVKAIKENGYDEKHFDYLWAFNFGSLAYGYRVNDALKERGTYEEVYTV